MAKAQAHSRPTPPVPDPAKRIRVLFVLNSLCVGGAEKHVVSLINRFDQRRFAVSLVYLKREEELLPQLDVEACPEGLVCLDVQRGFDWRATGALARHIDERHVDIVVCTNMYALLYGWIARARARRRPRMVEVYHTTDVGNAKERLSMQLYKQLVRVSDLIVYVCHGQARQWRADGMRARQDTVIYNGIDTQRFVDSWSGEEKQAIRASHGFSDSDYVVGLCAVLRPEKAHGDLIAAAARLREQGLAVKCLLIGDGPERARVEAQARDTGLADHVVITGFLQDVRPVIAACDVMVLASHAVETFSLAALEAMALGKPMVMTRIGGAPEQITQGENGMMYPPGDIDALADSLRQLADPVVRRRMGDEAAARVVSNFDVNTMVRSFEQAFSALAAGKAVTASQPGAAASGVVTSA